VKRKFRLVFTVALVSLVLSACGGGGGSTPPVTVTPTPFPTGNPTSSPTTSPASAACPTSAAAAAVSATSGSGGTFEVARRAQVHIAPSSARYVPGAIAVTYFANARTDAIQSKASALNASRTGEVEFSALGLRTRVVSVDPSHVDEAMSQFKAVPGVRSVSPVAYRRRMAVTSNDPYFLGFGAPAPYFETSSTPGQWDMHAMNVDTAWNDVTNSAPVNGADIAVVDTGVDVTHPELAGGRITRTQCFVTFPSGSAQTTSTIVTDTDGHGTNVAGIADGDTNNSLGFASVANGAHILAYRIFPSDPSGGCEKSTSPQCESNTFDEASAINDAVAHGAKVINLSLGSGGPCSTNDPEYIAVENAIAHNVVVVAAAGNETSGALDCPAADPGVIAVGASSLDDSVSPAKEVVASYSNFLLNNGGGRYVVAPGGDPSSADTTGTTTNYLHWITNIYSSTAAQPGTCRPDFNSTSTTTDCRVLIAGTSQATPHVVGVASLILAVRPSYTPTQVAAAICNSAADIADSKQGCGRVDAAAAVSYAKNHP
jgi:subtilisin family serine protease